jgi:hypothetical protein
MTQELGKTTQDAEQEKRTQEIVDRIMKKLDSIERILDRMNVRAENATEQKRIAELDAESANLREEFMKQQAEWGYYTIPVIEPTPRRGSLGRIIYEIRPRY